MAGWDKFLQSGTLPNFFLGYNFAGGLAPMEALSEDKNTSAGK